MADVEVTYKGNTIGSLSNSGTLTLQTAGKYLEGDVGIGYTSPGGGGSVKVGALRPDAELWKSWSYDKLIVEDEGVTLPAYSTSETVLRSGSQLDSISLSGDTSYTYFIAHRGLVTPVYSSTPNSAHIKQAIQVYCGEIVNIPYTVLGVDSAAYSFGPALWGTLGGYKYIAIYGSNATNKITWTGDSLSYGTYWKTAPVSYNSSTKVLTVTEPSACIKGYSSLMSSASMGLLTDIRYQYVIELWRVPVTQSDYGFAGGSSITHVLSCINDNGKLT